MCIRDRATGRQIAFIFNDSVITNPRVNCSIESGAFQITSVLDEKLGRIAKAIRTIVKAATAKGEKPVFVEIVE